MNFRILLLAFFPCLIYTDHQTHRSHHHRKSQSKSSKLDTHSNNQHQSDQLTERRRETSKFLKQIHDSLWKVASKNHEIDLKWDDLNEQFLKIRTNMGSYSQVVIYNCTYPTYISLDAKKQAYLSSSQKEKLKSEDECSSSDNIWRLKDDPTYLSTLDAANLTLSADIMPFKSLLDIFNYLKLCEQFLYFIRHPSMFLRNFKRPAECLHNSTLNVQKTSTKSITTKSTSLKTTAFQLKVTKRPITANPFMKAKFCPGGR